MRGQTKLQNGTALRCYLVQGLHFKLKKRKLKSKMQLAARRKDQQSWSVWDFPSFKTVSSAAQETPLSLHTLECVVSLDEGEQNSAPVNCQTQKDIQRMWYFLVSLFEKNSLIYFHYNKSILWNDYVRCYNTILGAVLLTLYWPHSTIAKGKSDSTVSLAGTHPCLHFQGHQKEMWKRNLSHRKLSVTITNTQIIPFPLSSSEESTL